MNRKNWKKQTFWSLPVHTGDVSGVCSALYELGGMVVMHDPSGCNSTYNTHDEIRWMDMESLIFLSGLRDIDAITGNDQKLIDDITKAAAELKPKFIAIANSPVPWLIGTDFRSICKKVEEKTGIPAFHVGTNAMHDYTVGAGDAFRALAEFLFKDRENGWKANGSPARLRVNVLGMTPLDFTVRSQKDTLRKLLENAGFEVISCGALGDSLETLSKASEADVNRVVSSTGLSAAKFFEEKSGIPWVAGIPVHGFSDVLFEALAKAAESGVSQAAYLEVLKNASEESRRCAGGEAGRCVVGEPVTMGSVAAAMALSDGRACDIVCLTEVREGLLGKTDSIPEGEEEIRKVLGMYHEVTGDPMLRHVCRKDADFHELPHFAYSGRVYLNRIPALME